MTAAAPGRADQEHWIHARLAEITVVVIVWVVVVVLRILARGADRVPYDLKETTAYLVFLAAVMAGLLVSTALLAPRSSGRVVPAVATLMGAGYLLVSIVAEPIRLWNQLVFKPGNAPKVTGEKALLAYYAVGLLLYVVVLILVTGRFGWVSAGIVAFTRRSWKIRVILIGSGVVVLFGLVFLTAGRGATTIKLWGLPDVQPGDLVRVMAVGASALSLSRLGLRLRLDAERPGGILPFLRLPTPVESTWAVGVPMVGVVLFGLVGDLGPAIILAIGTALLVWFATDHARYLVVTLVALLGVAAVVVALPFSLGTPSERFKAWLDFDPPQQLEVASAADCPDDAPPSPPVVAPDADPITCDFGRANGQVARSKMLVALGALGGVGVGSGRGYKIEASQNDSALAVLGESLGLLGVGVVLMALMVFCLEAVGAGYRSGGATGLFVAGIGMLYCVQGVLIAAGILGYLPLTGVTYPLISVGGASTATFFAAAAIVVFVSSRPLAVEGGGAPIEPTARRRS